MIHAIPFPKDISTRATNFIKIKSKSSNSSSSSFAEVLFLIDVCLILVNGPLVEKVFYEACGRLCFGFFFAEQFRIALK